MARLVAREEALLFKCCTAQSPTRLQKLVYGVAFRVLWPQDRLLMAHSVLIRAFVRQQI